MGGQGAFAWMFGMCSQSTADNGRAFRVAGWGGAELRLPHGVKSIDGLV